MACIRPKVTTMESFSIQRNSRVVYKRCTIQLFGLSKKKSAKINFKIENKFTSVNKIKLWAIRLSICTHECIVYEAKYHKVKKRSEIKTTKRHRKQTFYYYDHILCHRHAKLLITHIIYFHTTHTTYYWLNWSKFCLKLSWIWRGKHGFKLQCRCWVLH